MLAGNLKIEYGGVESGYVTLRIRKGFSIYELIFNELLSDPFPKLVRLFIGVRRGEDCAEDFTDPYDDRIVVLKISAHFVGREILLTVELVNDKIILKEIFQREDFLRMIRKVINGLLNDKYFPYSYPCFGYLNESCEAKYSYTVMDIIERSKSDWSMGDVLNYATETGRLKLDPYYEKYLEKYKRMLTDLVIPEEWFD